MTFEFVTCAARDRPRKIQPRASRRVDDTAKMYARARWPDDDAMHCGKAHYSCLPREHFDFLAISADAIYRMTHRCRFMPRAAAYDGWGLPQNAALYAGLHLRGDNSRFFHRHRR